ncbi:hypothetical protein [Persicitalea jodogahamensis]|uniref:Uncharacterized protein n=1 Tax=Persicitalea jodogahamensis TaxID=402147 RepID=A0A8J3G916_9BACT|nr:hypothetical protein [Persicitalea jodogahamensis]GHB63020.1 hypothetical protein GCM10007390_16070 [Persicitalea jodogahamensis]
MKKRNLIPLVYGLALTLVLFNCQRLDEPLSTTPNADLLKGFTAIKMPNADLVTPQAVVTTPSALLPAAVSLDFKNGMTGANGKLPAEFQKAVDALNSSLSADEMKLFSEVNPEVVKNLMAGGALPDNMKRVVERAESSPALSIYLTKPVLPTVQEIKPVVEKEVKEDATARTAANTSCKKQAQDAYQATLAQLREQRSQQLAAALLANQQAVAAANAAAAACKSSVSFATERAAAQQRLNQAIATIQSSNYPSYLKNLYIVLATVQYYAELNQINQLEAQARVNCDRVKIAAIVAASSALNANRNAIQDNFDAAVAAAAAQIPIFIANCEYQQGQGI